MNVVKCLKYLSRKVKFKCPVLKKIAAVILVKTKLFSRFLPLTGLIPLNSPSSNYRFQVSLEKSCLKAHMYSHTLSSMQAPAIARKQKNKLQAKKKKKRQKPNKNSLV